MIRFGEKKIEKLIKLIKLEKNNWKTEPLKKPIRIVKKPTGLVSVS